MRSLAGRLRDDSVRVRRTTLTVLTHLILNDMVKVKGQISEVAERLVDPEETLRGELTPGAADGARSGPAAAQTSQEVYKTDISCPCGAKSSVSVHRVVWVSPVCLPHSDGLRLLQ